METHQLAEVLKHIEHLAEKAAELRHANPHEEHDILHGIAYQAAHLSMYLEYVIRRDKYCSICDQRERKSL